MKKKARRLRQPEVFINGKLISPQDYKIEDGRVTFLKPFIELSPKPKEFDENGKPIFWVVISYEWNG